MSVPSALRICLVMATLTGFSAAARAEVPARLVTDRPNIVFLLADDLGYGDLSCYGQQKFGTPNIDRLAADGMKFTTMYAGNAVCAPSRSVFMTGLHPGHTYIRDNKEMRAKYGEGQYPIPADSVTLPKLLKKAGYVTGVFGKWGLGSPTTEGEPLKQGIDRFYGYNCQYVAHNYYPTYLWDDGRKVPLDNPDFSPRQPLPPGVDPTKPEAYARYSGKQFAPDLITDEALKFVRANKDQPFFLYYPTTVPHLALQVPADSLAPFVGKFPEEPYVGDRGFLPSLTPRAAYAGMVTRMDRDVGRILSLLSELKLDERTIVVFASDNGPLYDKLGGTDADFFNSASGFRGRKGSLYEGGVRVPGLVRWTGRVAAGSTSDRVVGFEDLLPTLLDLAGLSSAVPKSLDGISFADTLGGKTQPARPFLYREFAGYGGWQSIREGDWKAVRQNLNPGPKAPNQAFGKLQLFNLATDPYEERDVAAEHPDVVAKLTSAMAKQHVRSAVFPIKALDQ